MNLYRVQVKVAYDIVVAAPSAEIAQHPDVLSSHYRHLMAEFEDQLDELPRENVSLQTMEQIQSLKDIPSSYIDNLPYEHPDHGSEKELSCREIFESQ